MNLGVAGLLRSKIWVMRFVRQFGDDGVACTRSVPSETRYAIPESHSHQLLCVFRKLATTVLTRVGLLGLVTSWTSCELAVARSRKCFVRVLSWLSSASLQARTIWAPPASPTPDGPGIWNRNFGCRASVQSTIEVPF